MAIGESLRKNFPRKTGTRVENERRAGELPESGVSPIRPQHIARSCKDFSHKLMWYACARGAGAVKV